MTYQRRGKRGAILGVFFLLVALLAAQVWGAVAGGHQVGWRKLEVIRPDATAFEALVFYPATSASVDAPLDPSNSPYPAVSFGHGLMALPILYSDTMRHLAGHGYIVIATMSGLELSLNCTGYAADMNLCLEFIVERNDLPGSFLYQGVDTDALGLSGHSLGGGSALVAASLNRRVKALAVLTPSLAFPSPVEAASLLTIPVCLVTCSQDQVTPIFMHGGPIFNAANAPRVMTLIEGGAHFGFMHHPFPYFFRENQDITAGQQRELGKQVLTNFFDLYLKKQQSAWSRVWGPDSRAIRDILQIRRPGIELLPSLQLRRSARGGTATFQLTVTNRGIRPDRFEFLASGNRDRFMVDPPRTVQLVVGQSATVEVTLGCPSGQRGYARTVFSARSENDGLTRRYATLILVPGEGRRDRKHLPGKTRSRAVGGRRKRR